MRTLNITVAATITLLSGAILIQGCAHSAIDQRIDDKIAQESPIKDAAAYREGTKVLIENAPGLSPEQRSKLAALRISTQAQSESLRNQSLKLRSLLIKDILSQNYDSDEVQAIKSRLQDLSNKRLALVFDSVDQANSIMGRLAEQNQQVVRDFVEAHGGKF